MLRGDCTCRPLAPGVYNVTVSKEGYGSVRAEINVPEDGQGVQHDFLLPCKSCGAVRQELAEADAQVRARLLSGQGQGDATDVGLH